MLYVEERKPLIGGLIAAGACLAGTLALGWPGDFEARQLLDATLPTIRFLCSAIITASATILALMLTLLGLSFSTEHRLSGDHYRRIRRIARYDAVALVGALLFLVLLSMPVAESEKFPPAWFDWLYYGVLGIASLLAGWLAAIVFMLYDTISDLVEVSGLRRDDHPLIASDPGEEADDEPRRTAS